MDTKYYNISLNCLPDKLNAGVGDHSSTLLSNLSTNIPCLAMFSMKLVDFMFRWKIELINDELCIIF